VESKNYGYIYVYKLKKRINNMYFNSKSLYINELDKAIKAIGNYEKEQDDVDIKYDHYDYDEHVQPACRKVDVMAFRSWEKQFVFCSHNASINNLECIYMLRSLTPSDPNSFEIIPLQHADRKNISIENNYASLYSGKKCNALIENMRCGNIVLTQQKFCAEHAIEYSNDSRLSTLFKISETEYDNYRDAFFKKYYSYTYNDPQLRAKMQYHICSPHSPMPSIFIITNDIKCSVQEDMKCHTHITENKRCPRGKIESSNYCKFHQLLQIN
jgi:hypothetical protein